MIGLMEALQGQIPRSPDPPFREILEDHSDKMPLLPLLVALLPLLVIGDTSRWDAEIDTSLKRNIVGCPYRKEMLPTGPMLTTPSAAEFLVQVHYPSKVDVKTMKQLPITLTKADADLRNNTVRHEYTYDTWGKQTHSRWEVPADHPGQDKNNCINMTNIASSEQVVSFYEPFKTIKRAFYVMHARNAFIHPSGAVGLSCGYFIGMEACENRWNYAKNWYEPCKQALDKEGWAWGQLFQQPAPDDKSKLERIIKGCADVSDLGSPNKKDFVVSRHGRVFTIPALWDYNYHHFIADSLARLARNLRYLKTNKDIMIHVRAFEDYDGMYKKDEGFKQRAKKMRNEFFVLLGIDPARVISGPVFAQEVFIPRFLRCSYLLSNPVEIQLLAKQLLQAAYAAEGIKQRVPTSRPHKQLGRPSADTPAADSTPAGVAEKTMIIQQRFTAHGSNYRQWSNETMTKVVKAFTKHFPEHRLVIHNSANLKDRSVAKELIAFSQADVLIGLHGAGFTSMMFMPPNSLIVEMVGRIVDVHMPICGYYGPMAAAMGHHHYIHSYTVDSQDVREDIAAEKAAGFYQVVKAAAKDTPVLRLLDSVKEKHQGGG